MYELLKEQFDATVDSLRRTVFNQGNATQRLIMALYATIIEQVDSAIVLIDSGRDAGVEGILRSCLEAYVDLQNLANDDSYSKQMEAHYHEQWRLVCKDAIGGANPFLSTIEADAPTRLQEHIDELAKLPKPLSIKQRFDQANLSHIYYSVYNGLCSETHNNLRALIDRHFSNVGHLDKPVLEIMIFRGMDKPSFDAAVDGFITLLAESNRIVHHYLNSGELEALEIFPKRRAAMAQSSGLA